MKRAFYHYLMPASTILSTTIIAGLLLASNYSHATSRTVGASVTVSEACTMTSTNDSPHTATLSPNTYSGASGSDYENGIGKTTLAVVCNDSNGFAIYAIGYTGNSYDSADHTKLVGYNSNLAIDTAVYNSGDTTSSWSMKVNKVTDSTVSYNPQNMSILNSFDSWHAVPASYTKVAQYHASTGSSTTDSTLGAKVTTTYAAYIAQNQPADTYVGQVKYTMVHPYYADARGCNPNANTISEALCMQDINVTNKATILSSMNSEQQYFLKDKRDGKKYAVAKLKDNNIWMTQNLDHDIKTDGSVTYDNTTTDLGWNGTGYSTASWTPASATKVTSDTTWTTGSAGNTIPESYDPGELYWNGAVSPQNQSQSDCESFGGTWDGYSCSDYNTISAVTSSTGDSHYHLGNYYNWTAAVAMNDSSSYTTVAQDVDQSICPAGWTLPKSGNSTSSGSFQYLFEQYGLNAGQINPNIWNTAIKFPLSGGWTGSLRDVSDTGYFWSPVVAIAMRAYSAFVYSQNGVYSDNLGVRYWGESIRCVAR